MIIKLPDINQKVFIITGMGSPKREKSFCFHCKNWHFKNKPNIRVISRKIKRIKYETYPGVRRDRFFVYDLHDNIINSDIYAHNLDPYFTTREEANIRLASFKAEIKEGRKGMLEEEKAEKAKQKTAEID